MPETVHSRRDLLLARARCSMRNRLHLPGPRSMALELYPRDFFFVHINKTGGSSIEQALGAPFLHMPASVAREQLGDTEWTRRFTFTFVRNPWDKVASHYRYRIARQHRSLATHPVPFPEWVRRAYGDRDPVYVDVPLMFADHSTWLDDADGNLLVAHVARFERLPDDFAEVCRQLGRPTTGLPHLKQSTAAGGSFRDLYDDTAREVVATRFARDIERWGYTFD